MTRLTDGDDLLLESSGAPVSEWDEIAVLDDQDRVMADGQQGELVTRGPYTIRGYYNAPDVNARSFTADGFYRMGDIVRKRGRYVYTEGRRKDLINRGGEKACACVVLHPGTELTFDELIAHLRAQQIASFKLPERLEVMTAFPISPVGKILKRELREIVAQRIAAETASQ